MAADIHQNLHALIDEQAIKALVIRYTTTLDRQDWEGFRACFSAEVAVDTAGLRGELASTMDADAWVRRVRGSRELFEETLHYVSNQEVELAADEAVCRSYLLAQHWMAGNEASEGGHFVAYGLYTHRAQRTPDGWRIVSVALDFKRKEGEIGARKNEPER